MIEANNNLKLSYYYNSLAAVHIRKICILCVELAIFRKEKNPKIVQLSQGQANFLYMACLVASRPVVLGKQTF